MEAWSDMGFNGVVSKVITNSIYSLAVRVTSAKNFYSLEISVC
jgi:hypothetical protein